MTLEIDRKRYIFKIKEIWFSDYPYDVKNYHSVIFRECKNKVNIKGFEGKEQNTLVIDLTQDLDTILGNMDRDSCRYAIRRAAREGIHVRLNQDYREFYDLNRSFRQKKGLPTEPQEVETMTRYGTLFTAELEGEIIAGHLYLEDKDNIRWLLGASRRLEVSKTKATLMGYGNRLIVWEAIKYAKEKGIKEFDLGGYYTGEAKDEQREAINVFKKAFGGELTTHYIYQKDYSRLIRFARRMYQLRGGHR